MSGKQKLSVFHQAQRKKMSRKECPGCKQSFTSRYFRQHREKYFSNNQWNCFKSVSENVEVLSQDIDEEFSDSSSDENLSSQGLHDVFQSYVRKHFSENNCTAESESEDEVWNNASLEDLDLDLQTEELFESNDVNVSNPNMKFGTLLMWFCMFICTWQAIFMLPDCVIDNLLSFLSTFFCQIGKESFIFSSLATIFPGSVYLLWKKIGLKKDNFTKYVVCRKCFSIYLYNDCLMNLEGETVSAKCPFVEYPNHTQPARRRPCGELLLKSVTLLDGTKKLYPFKSYCYKPIQESLQDLVKRPGFEDLCNHWRSRKQSPGFLTDIYDGNVWKEFQSSEKNSFLTHRNNYGLMLNLDWFQPFKHVKYSVGVLYAVILNLPRDERFKLKNVLLIGVIPDLKHEPSVNSFITPLVNELKVAWSQGFQLASSKSSYLKKNFKVALMCVGCDIPATRKLCGFLGHSATLGCSKCFKKFPGSVGNKDYSGFDVENWPVRTLDDYNLSMKAVKKARTQTEKERLEASHGVKYSVLSELDYFNPIRMSIVDPMHNLFQGTAKKMMKMWLDLKVLHSDQLVLIQEKVDSVDAASNIGAIPRKIASSFGGFTAEQWKNWTIFFSIFALADILPKTDLDVWRNFVLACRALTSKFISSVEIARFDSYIITFCKGVERVYGCSSITPNIHMHCHLSQCVLDYGPVYSFWLFSFERYNGHLGSMPNNSRSIEMQLMRGFLRDSFVHSLQFPSLYVDEFKKHFPSVTELCGDKFPTDSDILKILYMSKKSAQIVGQDWQICSAFECKKLSCHVLSSADLDMLKKTYKHIYPELYDYIECIPKSFRKCSSICLRGEVYGSNQSRHKRSSFVMAYWHSTDGKIIEEVGSGELRPGVIQYFLQHNLIVDDESRVHLFAKVLWLASLPNMYRYHCGKPVELWRQNVFDTFGPSAFIPVQRISCKYICADGMLLNKCVSYICPVIKGVNV